MNNEMLIKGNSLREILRRSFLLILIFTFHLSPFTSFAQITHNSQGRLDENATAALEKCAKKLKNVSGTVTLTVFDSQKKVVAKQTADVKYSSGKYSLNMEGQEIVSDGVTVWHLNNSAKEVTIENVSDDDIDLLNPGRMLQNYNKSFRAKYIRTDDDGTVVVDMQPRSSRSYHKIRLFINEESGALNRIEVHKYDSSREVYEFSKCKYGRVSGSFKYDPKANPGFEVIDMR